VSSPATKEAAESALRAGRLAEAATLYESLCATAPRDSANWSALGEIQAAIGEFANSVVSLKKAVTLNPQQGSLWASLGASQLDLGKLDEAAESLHTSLQLHPNQPGAHYNLAATLVRLGRHDEAIDNYRQAIALNPLFAEAWLNLSSLYSHRGEYNQAIRAAEEALRLRPAFPEARNNLGQALAALGQNDQAVECYRAALKLSPDYPEAHSNLAASLVHRGRPQEAGQHARRALQLRPDFPEATNNLGNALIRLGEIREAVRVLSAVPVGDRGHDLVQDNRLLALNYDPDLSPGTIADEHRLWGHRHTQAGTGAPRQSHRRLRVAYLSPDFSAHSVSFFIEPILRHHDRMAFEIHAYANQAGGDHVTDRLRGCCDHWHTVHQINDDRLAEQIRADEIDILIELAGHLRDNRLGVLARKPVPVQISYLGYPNTTGLEAVNFSLTDSVLDPPGTESLYTETLLRLPAGFACYQPPTDAPAVSPLPMLANGHVTFGSFHTLAKLNRDVLSRWSKLLHQLPAARLRLQTFGLGEPAVCEQVLQKLTAIGIGADRIELRAECSFPDYLRAHHEVDICLDTLPWSGHTVTCHALWMGVPTVTLPGNRRAGRLGASALAAAGLRELVATDEGDWLERTAALAADPARLGNLRAGLRDRLRSSPLCDAGRFVAGLESAYRKVLARG